MLPAALARARAALKKVESDVKNKTVAIVGATGAVGREFVGCIESRGVPLASLKLLASARSVISSNLPR